MAVATDQPLRVAVVSRDTALRLKAARAFDRAPATWAVTLHESAPTDVDIVVVAPDVDAAGDIRFDPQRPEAVVDEISRATTAARSTTVVVTSASGGTGATSIALHLAAWAGGSTCFVDLDVLFGASHRLGLFETHMTWRDIGETPEALMLAAVPLAGGFRALLSPGDGVAPDDARVLIDRAAEAFEHVVVDVPDGRLLEASLDRGRRAVLVMRPDVVSAHRSRRLLDRFPEVKWAVVSNRLGAGGETTRRTLEKILGHTIALECPCAPALRDAADEGRLLASRLWRYSRAIARLHLALEKA